MAQSSPAHDPASGVDADVDGDLIVRSRDDPQAFGTLYDRTHAMVLRYFLERTADAATAADLASETFARALEGRWRYRSAKGNGGAWLIGIARHVLQQYQRKERTSTDARRRASLDVARPDLSAADLERIEALVDFRPMTSRLAVGLHQLSPHLRDAVLLRVVDQLPYDQIAERLGCTQGNARVRVCRGLDRLEAILGAPQ